MTTRTTATVCIAALGLLCGACGATLSQTEATQLRRQLRDAMSTPVQTREQRDEQSRLVADIVEQGALDGLNHSEIRAALGSGQACRSELCREQGFGESDWSYDVGVASGDEVVQLPVLIVGFDPRGRVERVYTLTTH